MVGFRGCVAHTLMRRYVQGVKMSIDGHCVVIKIGSYEFMTRFIRDGEMFFRRAKSFRKGFGIERGDKNELLTQALDPKNTTLTVNGIEVTGIVSTILVDDGVDNPLIYSMYSVGKNHLLPNRPHLIDPKCKNFGDYAVIITDLNAFYEKLKQQHDRFGYGIVANPIQYVAKDYVGELGCFKKFADGYDHQEEWRIVLDNLPSDVETKTLNLGSLEDIAILCKFEDIENIIKVKGADCT